MRSRAFVLPGLRWHENRAAEIRALVSARLAISVECAGDIQVTTRSYAEYVMMAARAAGGFVATNLDVARLARTRAELERRFAVLDDLLLADFSGGFRECVVGTVPRALVAGDIRDALRVVARSTAYVVVDPPWHWTPRNGPTLPLVAADSELGTLMAWLDVIEQR